MGTIMTVFLDRSVWTLGFLLIPFLMYGQEDSLVIPHTSVEDLEFMVIEAFANNPEIQAAAFEMDVAEGKAQQAGTLDDPELRYMREEMPGFRFNANMWNRIELMQMLRFPTKLASQSRVASIQADHAHHEHLEKINEVLASLKSAYYELWYVQQALVLTRMNIALMKRIVKTSETQYRVGTTSQQGALKARIELSRLQNDLIMLRQKELGVKAMMMAILNRPTSDTIGFAIVPEDVIFTPSLETLQDIALVNRPMLKHDSLAIDEGRAMLSLSRQEYLPDIKLGVQYAARPVDGFKGWSIIAGVTIPFAPWTLGKASGRVQEANAMVMKARASYAASSNMVKSSVSELYFLIQGKKEQLEIYRSKIIPQAQQSLDASIIAYQTGMTDFLMLLDSYRTFVDLKTEYFMVRLEFEQAIARLERAVGYQGISTIE
jgi:cobalt-zinc-cadmium efflux system outer membrane protein